MAMQVRTGTLEEVPAVMALVRRVVPLVVAEGNLQWDEDPKLGYTYAGEIGLGFRPGLRFRCYEKRLAVGSEREQA